MKYHNNLTGNDRWIVEHIFPNERGRFYVEVGACNGIKSSSCYVLEKHLDWRGICVEPNDDYFQELIINRPGSICESSCLAACSGKVTYIEGDKKQIDPMRGGIKENLIKYKENYQEVLNKSREIVKEALSLADLLEKHNAPQVIDYLAMDIEGSEYPVLFTFPLAKYQILAISIEGFDCNDLLVGKGYLNVQNPFNTKELYEQFFIHPSIFNQASHRLTANHYLSVGNNLAQEGKTEAAIAAYQHAIEVEPNNAKIYAHLADYLQQQQDYVGAIANFRQALKIEPDYPVWVYANLGNVLQQQGKLQEATTAFKQAIAIEPQSPAWVYYTLGNILQQQGRAQEALGAYQKAIAIEPQSPAWVYYTSGNILQQQGKIREALTAYYRAIEIEPQIPDWIEEVVRELERKIDKFKCSTLLNTKELGTGERYF